MFLFVRELTGDARIGFVAGLLLAFAPYRLGHLAHLNLLSMQWAPLAMYAMRRYFDTGRRWPLAAAAVALVALHLSSGYHLLYFTPFVALYALWEVAARRLWGVRRIWIELGVAAAIVALVTAPFLVPYFLLSERLPTLRSLNEVRLYSADVYAYLTAPATLDFWGNRLRVYPRPEGSLFPGLVPVLLAVIGLLSWVNNGVSKAIEVPIFGKRPVSERLACTLVIGAFALVGLAIVVIYRRRFATSVGPIEFSANDVTRTLTFAAGMVAIAMTLSTRLRAAAIGIAQRPEAWALAMLVAAWWLSLGPSPTALGRPLDIAAPYTFLYEYVPGFTGVRVPARFAAVVAFALAVLAGFGLRVITRRRWGMAAVVALAIGFVWEVRMTAFPINAVARLQHVETPEPRVYPPAQTPPVYAAVRRLPPHAVLVEFPFGIAAYDGRAMYYSTVHWRRLINGYSSFLPPGYDRGEPFILQVTDDLQVPDDPEFAWKSLQRRGVTHALVHEAAYRGDHAARLLAWLREHGAKEIFRDGCDVLFALPDRSFRLHERAEHADSELAPIGRLQTGYQQRNKGLVHGEQRFDRFRGSQAIGRNIDASNLGHARP
jgi:hypothetical protein